MNFCMGTQNGWNLELWRRKYFDLHIRIKATPPRVPHSIGSHAFAILPIKNYGRAGYVDDPLPIIVYMAYLDACLHCVALLCIQLDSMVVLLSVWSPWTRKKQQTKWLTNLSASCQSSPHIIGGKNSDSVEGVFIRQVTSKGEILGIRFEWRCKHLSIQWAIHLQSVLLYWILFTVAGRL